MHQENDNEPSVEQTDSKAGPLRSYSGGSRSPLPLAGEKFAKSHLCNGEESKSSDLKAVAAREIVASGNASGGFTNGDQNGVSSGADTDEDVSKRDNDHDGADIRNKSYDSGFRATSGQSEGKCSAASDDKHSDVNRSNKYNGKCLESSNEVSNPCDEKNIKVFNSFDSVPVGGKVGGIAEALRVGNGGGEDKTNVIAYDKENRNGSMEAIKWDLITKTPDSGTEIAADVDDHVTTVAVYNGAKNAVKTQVSHNSSGSNGRPVGCGKGVLSFVRKNKKKNPPSSSSVSASPSSSSLSSGSSSSESSSEDELIPRSPDGGWGWMIVLASFVIHLIADGCAFSFGILYADLLGTFSESKFKTAWVGSLFVSMPAICGPIASIVTNLLGCRRTAALGGIIAAAGFFISFFATSIDMLCITYGVIAGFGLSLVYVPAVVIVAFYFEKKRSFATGLAVSGSGIGTFIFAPLTEQLIETYTWKGTMLVMSGLMLNIVVCATLFRPLVAHKLEVRRRRYLRSLERFSRVSSRIQSHDALDRRSVVCEHGNDDEDAATCVFCRADTELEPLSHSLIELPTYLSNRGHNEGHELYVADSTLLKVRRQSSVSLNLASCGGAGHSQHPTGTITVVTEDREQTKVVTGASNQIDECRQKEFGLETDVACMGFVDPMRGNFISEENNVRASGNAESHGDEEDHQDHLNESQAVVSSESRPPVKSTKSLTARKTHHHGGSLETVRVKKSPGQFPLRFVPQCRTDIFYRGSLLKAGFLLSRGQSASCPDVYVHTQRRRRSRRASICQRLHAMGLRSLWEAVKEACDFSIFRSAIFISFCLHSLLLYLSYDIPYVYIPDMATETGIPENQASFLISIIGITSTVGQVVMGYFGDRSYINCFYFYIVMILLAGAPILFMPILKIYPLLATFCALFGFFMSANYALTTIIVVDLLGMDQLTNAYGFVSLAEGLANLVGPPLAGFIADKSGYNITFYLAGAGVCVSALLLLVVPLLRRCDIVVGGGRKSKSCDEEGGGRRTSRGTNLVEEGRDDGSEGWGEYGVRRNKEGVSTNSDSSSENHVRFSVDY